MKILTEYRKGILFVRINGILNKDSVKYLNTKVTKIVNDVGITNLVFNFNNLKDIDNKGINAILYNYEIIKKNQGNVFICLNNNKIKDKINRFHLSKYIGIVKDELSAFALMKG